MMLSAAKLRFDCPLERIQPVSVCCRDCDFIASARDFIIRDEVALVIAFEHGRAGLCKFCNQAVHDRDMILALGISAVDDMDEQIGVFQLLKRGAECLDQMVRQLCDKADRIRQQRLTGIGDSQLPCRGVKRVEQSVVCRDVRARECVQKR